MDEYEDYEEEEFVAKSDRRYIVLIIYDIVDNKYNGYQNLDHILKI